MALLSRPFIQFKAVYESGSLSGAARRLGLTQPAITRGIRALETQLDLILFDRQGHRLAPTHAGEILYRNGCRIDEDIRRLNLELAAWSEARYARLRIGVGPIWSRYRIPEILVRLQREYPNVQLEVTSDIAPVLIEELNAKRLDLFVGELRAVSVGPGIKKTDLWSTGRSVWTAKDHPLAGSKSITLKDLSAYRWIGQGQDEILKSWIAGRFNREGIPPPELAIESTSLEFILMALVETDMIAVLADVIAPEADRRGLARLAYDLEMLTFSATAVHHAELDHLPPMRRLLQLLRSEQSIATPLK